MRIGSAKLKPTDGICEKLFACKGNKIFHTPLEYIFDAKDVKVSKSSSYVYGALNGMVLKTLDYGHTKYAVIDVCGQKLIAEYDGNTGDDVRIDVPVETITIKDKSIDIIIV